MMRFAPILLSVLLLAGQLGGVLHVYGHDAQNLHEDCKTCLKYSSLNDAVATTAPATLPHAANAINAPAEYGRFDAAVATGYAIRAPPPDIH